MLKAYPQNWFSWKFRILDEGNRNIALIDIGWIREDGELTLGQIKYRLYRERFFGGAFILEGGGQELARAEKPSAFVRSFTVLYRGRKYKLQAASPGRTGIHRKRKWPTGRKRKAGRRLHPKSNHQSAGKYRTTSANIHGVARFRPLEKR